MLTPTEQRREIERQARAQETQRQAAERSPAGLPPEESLGERVVRYVAYGIGGLIALGAIVAAVAAVVWIGGSAIGGLARSPGGTTETACQAAFRDAADGSVAGDQLYDLDPAMRACQSLGEWSAAFRAYPAPGAGDDPRFVAENRCLSGRFSDAPICRELGITP